MGSQDTDKYDLYNISETRALLLGIATLWVAVFHSYNVNFENSAILTTLHLGHALNLLKVIGNSGVDFFLFLSGFGLFFSFEKNNCLKFFYFKRFIRVIPEVLLVSFVYYGYIGAGEFSEWLSQVFLYGFFVKGLRGG